MSQAGKPCPRCGGSLLKEQDAGPNIIDEVELFCIQCGYRPPMRPPIDLTTQVSVRDRAGQRRRKGRRSHNGRVRR